MAHYPWALFIVSLALSAALWLLVGPIKEKDGTTFRAPAWLLPLLVIAGALFTQAFRGDERYYHRLADTPRLAIRDLRPGEACVTGRVMEGKQFKGPLSQVPCVYCQDSIFKYYGGGRSAHWG